MPNYRLHMLDGRTGQIDAAADFTSPDDMTAVETAAPLAGRWPIELWCGARTVCRFDARERGGNDGDRAAG